MQVLNMLAEQAHDVFCTGHNLWYLLKPSPHPDPGESARSPCSMQPLRPESSACACR